MSEKFKNSMDKIVMSSELKDKILKAAAEKENERKKIKSVSLKKYYSYAVCAAACIIAVFGLKGKIIEDLKPSGTEKVQKPGVTAKKDTGTEENTKSVIDTQGYKKETGISNNPLKPAAEEKGSESYVPEVQENTEIKEYAESSGIEEEDSADMSAQAEQEIPARMKKDDAADSIDAGETELKEKTSGGGSSDAAVYSTFVREEMETEEISKKLGYKIAEPSYMPKGYEKASPVLIGDNLCEITYESEDDSIVYRTQLTGENISGDYSSYAQTSTVKIASYYVTLKSVGDNCHLACWHSNFSHSIRSEKGIERAEMEKIIESIEK